MSRLAEMEPHHNLREWFLASVSVNWRRRVGPLVRKAYRTTSERERIDALRELAQQWRAWAEAAESVIRQPHPRNRRRGAA